ncbi:MAG: hypothetical protein MMC33_010121 [Icmadophila ericetorum]|nr:hypothetical protein [Icmadophila ericetorum]
MSAFTTRNVRSRSGRKKLSSPSVTSFLTTSTNNSSGSGGSNSTVTQESVTRSGKKPAKSNGGKKESAAKRAGRRIESKPPAMPPVEERPVIDVFAFQSDFEEDDEKHEKPSSEQMSSEARAERESEYDACNPAFDIAANQPSETQYNYHSSLAEEHHAWEDNIAASGTLHSDSGISVRSSSSERESPVKLRSRPSKPTDRRQSRETSIPPSYKSQASSHVSRSASPVTPEFYALNPEVYYSGDPQLAQQYMTYPPQYGYPPALQNSSSRSSPVLEKTRPRRIRHRAKETKESKELGLEKTGYDLLASNISSSDPNTLRPIYRKFETLNNRMLLHLQDEISELEADLQVHDEMIAEEAKLYGIRRASRRQEAVIPSELQWRRLQITRRLFATLEQYNHALSSYTAVSKAFSSPDPADIEAYKSFLKTNSPLDEAETAFLSHAADLTCVAATKGDTNLNSSLAGQLSIISSSALTILSVTFTFKLVPQFTSRMIMGAILGVAVMCYKKARLLNDEGEFCWEKGKYAIIYAASVAVLAITVG